LKLKKNTSKLESQPYMLIFWSPDLRIFTTVVQSFCEVLALFEKVLSSCVFS